MKKFKVGIQLYGVRGAMAEDFVGTLKAVRDMGYEYVEFAGFYDRTAEEIKSILDELGLKCISVHQKLDPYEKDPEAMIAFLKKIGVKYNVIPWYERSRLAGTEGWDDTVKKFKEASALLEKNGMKLGYHNHDFEFETHEGKYLFDYILEALGDGIEPELDTCWVHYAGLDPVAKLRELRGRAMIVHLKDFKCDRLAGGPTYDLIDENGKPIKTTREENNFEFTPLGRGRQNFAEILAACEDAGCEVVIVEQDKTYGGMTELEAARISREYLRDTFGI